MLKTIAGGGAVPPSPAFSEMLARQAVEGPPDAARLTPIGQHVLGELETRAYRCDGWPIDRLAEEETGVMNVLDDTAHAAEYFLSDLGPIIPDDAVPYLRIVSIGLANRRESPEELAERFRNVWGMLEVMGGDARDRLVGVELLMASGAAMSQIYAPMVSTVDALRAAGAVRAVGPAAILHLEPPGAAGSVVDRWVAARQKVPNDEAAALLATVQALPAQAKAFEGFRTAFATAPEMGGQISAAIYLASQGASPDGGLTERVLATARLFAPKSRRPLLSAALVTSEHGGLSPQELYDWVEKAAGVAGRRRVAASPSEFPALGLALVEGLPRNVFEGVPQMPGAGTGPLEEAATLLALHAWVYRSILSPEFEKESARAARAAAAAPPPR